MLRLGEISFINNFPLSQEAGALLQQATSHLNGLPIHTTQAPPKTLNEKILNGTLDVSSVSSVFYCRHHAELTLIPGPCIASNSPVLSVLYCYPQNSPPPTVIGLPDTSETSVFLLEWMLAQDGLMGACSPRFEIYARGETHQWLENRRAFLSIGDEALRLYSQLQAPNNTLSYHMIDLSRYWKAQTSLPCVFAVWVARKEWATQNPEAIQALSQHYRDRATAFRHHPAHQEAVFEEIQHRLPELYTHLGPHGLRDYLLNALLYELSPACEASLQTLQTLVAKHASPSIGDARLVNA